LLFLVINLAGFPALSLTDSGSDLRVPGPDEVLLELTKKSHQIPQIPNQFSLLTWNIHKGTEGAPWARDLEALASGSQLVLLQEAVTSGFMTRTLEQLQNLSFMMAQSFFFSDGISTGVATGSNITLEEKNFRQSPTREPITNTPKVTLLTVYQMQDGEPLLVMNIHGINFVTNKQWRQQLEDLRPYLLNFTGRIVFAGDFNTWNPGRSDYLDVFANQVGLHEVKFSNDTRSIKLDYIFLRGCTANKARLHSEIKTSDHFPLKAEIDCNSNKTAIQAANTKAPRLPALVALDVRASSKEPGPQIALKP
jgi:endonuclease/exonuclease/phosphatase (EEP) superfamily protein YafD